MAVRGEGATRRSKGGGPKQQATDVAQHRFPGSSFRFVCVAVLVRREHIESSGLKTCQPVRAAPPLMHASKGDLQRGVMVS